MAELRIRPVRDQDFSAIEKIYTEAVETTVANWEWTSPDIEELNQRYLALHRLGYPYIIAELDADLVGYAYASPFNSREGYKWTVEDSVYVDARHHGKGIGGKLLSALIEICTERSYRHMLAVVGSSENEASVKLHERYGFTLVGTVPGIGWKLDKWQDWLLMARPLGEGSKTPPMKINRDSIQ